jgi:hypothetical protein
VVVVTAMRGWWLSSRTPTVPYTPTSHTAAGDRFSVARYWVPPPVFVANVSLIPSMTWSMVPYPAIVGWLVRCTREPMSHCHHASSRVGFAAKSRTKFG